MRVTLDIGQRLQDDAIRCNLHGGGQWWHLFGRFNRNMQTVGRLRVCGMFTDGRDQAQFIENGRA